jgi:hypothetical protein
MHKTEFAPGLSRSTFSGVESLQKIAISSYPSPAFLAVMLLMCSTLADVLICAGSRYADKIIQSEFSGIPVPAGFTSFAE